MKITSQEYFMLEKAIYDHRNYHNMVYTIYSAIAIVLEFLFILLSYALDIGPFNVYAVLALSMVVALFYIFWSRREKEKEMNNKLQSLKELSSQEKTFQEIADNLNIYLA